MFRYYHYFRKILCLGIDINSQEIKMVRLQRNKTGYTLLKAVRQALLPEKTVAENLKILTRDHGLLGLPAAIALRQSDVILKSMRLPVYLSTEELQGEIKNRWGSHFSNVPESEWCFDYAVSSTNIDHHQLVTVAARKSVYQEQLNLLRQSGLRLCVVDVDIYALARVVSAESTSAPVILLHGENRYFQGMVTQAGKILFHHEGDGGEEDLTFIKALKTWWQDYSATSARSVKCVFLSGGLADERYLNLVKEALPYSISLLNPFQNMDYDQSGGESIAHDFALCCGLAMREAL